MKIQPIRKFAGDIVEAHEAAKSDVCPLYVPAPIYTDDRGWSIMNQLQGVMDARGQINYSVMYPGVVKAWHRHHRQTDFWLCVSGHLRVGVCGDDGRAWQVVTGEKNPGVLIIPPPLWHGAATVSHEPAGLIYYVTEAYDPNNPDEDRREFDSVDGFSWGIQHR